MLDTKQELKLVQCKVCDTLFYAPKATRTTYCSKSCRRISDNLQRRRRKLFPTLYPQYIKCKVCKKTFKKQHHQVYCSEDCKVVGERLVRRLKKMRYKRFLFPEPRFTSVFMDEMQWSEKEEIRIQKMIDKWNLEEDVKKFNEIQNILVKNCK